MLKKTKSALPRGWRKKLQMFIFNRTGRAWSLVHIDKVIAGTRENMVIMQNFIEYCQAVELKRNKIEESLKAL